MNTLLDFFHRSLKIRLPSTFVKGDDINSHIRNVEKYIDEMEIKSEESPHVLINTLDERVQHELFSCLEFKENKRNMQWIINKLKETYGIKESQVSPLAKLLKIRQGHSMSLRDFLSEIRVHAYRIMGDENPDLREKYMIKAFLHGLSDRTMAVAAEEIEYDTLDECFRAIRKEDKVKHPNVTTELFMMQTTENERIQKLENEVRYLKRQIQELLSKMESKSTPKSNNFHKPQGRIQQLPKNNDLSKVKCFSCCEFGHYRHPTVRTNLFVKSVKFRDIQSSRV